MPWLIETYDKPDHNDVRLRVRPRHMVFLEENKQHLLACGAKLDDAGERASGDLFLLDFETREEAEQFIAQDPFTTAELFERVEIHRWRMAFYNRQSRLGGRGQGGGGGGRPGGGGGGGGGGRPGGGRNA